MRLVLVWTKPSLGLFSALHTDFHRAAGMGPQAHRRFLPWRCSLWVTSHCCPPSVPERGRSKGEVAWKKALFQLRCSVCQKEEHAAAQQSHIFLGVVYWWEPGSACSPWLSPVAGTVALQFLDTQSLTALCETGESVVLCWVWGGLCSRHPLP